MLAVLTFLKMVTKRVKAAQSPAYEHLEQTKGKG